MQHPIELCRNNLHPAHDKTKTGQCRSCSLATDKAYKAKQRAALELVRALEAQGVHVDLDTMALGTDPGATPEAVAQSIVNRFGEGIE
ncbi:hypothetical protein C8E05_1565 [Rhodococcus wratislaviensis]|uniref:Uncharacterized protein n=1 Tax=Rhodococcus wratislaviensis TaxID=44752 RepID=A0AB38FI48_RHOWR|nr:hypothetical protein [Rhodococcus wratislaviensis]REE72177.1 hypothetical protein C8E05_1565 [Rhodococcus wratislaviensis]SPZ40807.1 Uncharacterised protein [Rhodococcus wratislaviensis]